MKEEKQQPKPCQHKITKNDAVMQLVVSFSGQTFSEPKEAYAWLDKNIRQLIAKKQKEAIKKFIKDLLGVKKEADPFGTELL